MRINGKGEMCCTFLRDVAGDRSHLQFREQNRLVFRLHFMWIIVQKLFLQKSFKEKKQSCWAGFWNAVDYSMDGNVDKIKKKKISHLGKWFSSKSSICRAFCLFVCFSLSEWFQTSSLGPGFISELCSQSCLRAGLRLGPRGSGGTPPGARPHDVRGWPVFPRKTTPRL